MTAENIANDQALDILFREARSFNAWRDVNVSETLLKSVYDLTKYGPTSANCLPARFIYLKSPEAKERVKPYLAEGNVEKTMTAPVCVIIGHDMRFYEKLPELFPHTDAKGWFVGNDQLIYDTAFRNASMQGAYFILAARALGLDCGPMSGFDEEGVTREFFGGTDIKANFLCNIGYGDPDSLFPRSPRMEFYDACEIL